MKTDELKQTDEASERTWAIMHESLLVHAIHGRALPLAHAQKRAGNRAEKCCVTGVCLALLLRSPQPSFIFRVFGDARKQLLCALSKTGWVDVRKREWKEEEEEEGR